MNFLAHFLGGYILARAIGYKYNQFETFFLSLAATIPDFDILFIPFFPHGTWTHTILYGLLMAIPFALFFSALIRKNPNISNVGFFYLLGMAMIGVMLHLFMDIFTYLRADPCSDTIAHLYLYPFSNQSFHMNCVWSGVEYWHRVLVEYLYLTIAIVWVGYRWKKHGENLFHLINKNHWEDVFKQTKT